MVITSKKLAILCGLAAAVCPTAVIAQKRYMGLPGRKITQTPLPTYGARQRIFLRNPRLRRGGKRHPRMGRSRSRARISKAPIPSLTC